MAQAKIYWDLGDYQQVEKIFRKSVEFCSEHDVWKLNVAHVLFMQVRMSTVIVSMPFMVMFPYKETKFKEAAGFYEAIVKKNYDNVSVCVYIVKCIHQIFIVSTLLQLLGISAIILANLCVSYIMTSHTEEVELCNVM